MGIFNYFQGELKTVKDENRSKDERINTLEKSHDEQAREITRLQTVNKSLKDANEDLIYQVDAANQYSRRDNIKIFGIPFTKGENLFPIIKKTVNHLGVSLEEKDISVAHRLNTKDTRVEGDKSAIIVKFVRREKKNEVFLAKKKLRTEPLNEYGDLRIYEDVTPLRNRMLYHLRNRKNSDGSKKFAYTWTRDGRIHWRSEEEARKTPQPPAHAVNTPKDLAKLGFSQQEIYDIVNNVRTAAPTTDVTGQTQN